MRKDDENEDEEVWVHKDCVCVDSVHCFGYVLWAGGECGYGWGADGRCGGERGE